ncbi:MAG: MlaD family protein [Nitriliruptorales bacterium]|nr:MlaD family protein [Nitriliruptorales bacterium]
MRDWWREFSFEDMNRATVGVLGMATVAALVAITFAIGSLGLLEDTYEMSGVFEDGSGIKGGAPVRLAGVEVGEVTGVFPDFELGQVVVTWHVDRAVDLGLETEAKIALGSLLGGNYIRLTSIVEPAPGCDGTADNPCFVADQDPDARRIPLERTDETIGVIEAFDAATRTIEELDSDLINDVTAQLAEIMAGTRDSLPDLVTNLETVAVALSSREAELTRLLEDGQSLLETLNARDTEILRLIDAADELLDELETRQELLRAILGDGADAVDTLATLIADHRAEIQKITDDLHVTLLAAGERIPQLNEGLALFGPTFQGLGSVTNAGPWIDFVVYELGPVNFDQ